MTSNCYPQKGLGDRFQPKPEKHLIPKTVAAPCKTPAFIENEPRRALGTRMDFLERDRNRLKDRVLRIYKRVLGNLVPCDFLA